MGIENIIEMKNVDKRFGGIHALKNVSFSVKKGSVHGLVGENGAGKSTLMKILSGVYTKDEGEILINESEVNIQNLSHCQKLGIALVPQELSLVPYFTVAENIFLGREPRKPATKLLDWKKLFEQTEALLNELQIDLNPREKVSELSVSQQQMIVLAKALSLKAEIIIFDEPTARLGHNETMQLLQYIKYLKSKGISTIYISHHLSEVFNICDDITVLRDGKTVATKKIAEVDEDEVIKMMVDRYVKEDIISRDTSTIGEEFFRVEGLNNKDIVKDVNFSLKRGEILGISGLVGAGRTEMIRSLLGIDSKDSGKVFLEGNEIKIRSIRDAIGHGLAIVPEERRGQGLVLDLSIRENIALVNLHSYSKYGLVNQHKEKKLVNQLTEKLKVRMSSCEQKAGNLSGGNQQKVVLAKWMNRPIKVFFLDEPTRGIDVGAKSEIYKLINSIASAGASVVMISSEIPELQAVCDRVLVMKEGRITAELDKTELSAERILSHAIADQ